jgi:signal transduction histidine kinase
MKLSEMKADFVSNVSHELRTPISSIRVFGEFMRLGRVTSQEKVREYGEYIETESRRLTQLINNILDFSKIESGGKVYQLEETDLEEVVEGALKIFDVRLQHSGFKIDYREPVSHLPMVRIDASAVGQALCNLLDNAVKYSGDEREIRVSLGRANGSAVISVTDHGIGISEQEQQRIFDRFHRVSTGLVHDVKGSGLGLSIVQHVVLAHGGRVTVDSRPGNGSTFSIYLPIHGDEGSAERGEGVETESRRARRRERELGWERP